jgi:hypothetical protein
LDLTIEGFQELQTSAEANAILLALKFVASSDESKFMICSDSLSCLLAIESCKTQNPFILKKPYCSNCLASVLKYLIIKGLKSLRNRTIGYMIFQCVICFLIYLQMSQATQFLNF